jgi:hypothetical protein
VYGARLVFREQRERARDGELGGGAQSDARVIEQVLGVRAVEEDNRRRRRAVVAARRGLARDGLDPAPSSRRRRRVTVSR